MTVPLFDLPDSVRQIFQDGVDTIINDLGRPCKIVFDSVKTECPNCHFDSTNGRSSGVYNGTGPRPFTRPPCPVCRGTGYDPAAAPSFEIRKFLIERNVRPSRLLLPVLDRPVTIAHIKGYAVDLPLMLQMKFVVLDYENAKYTEDKYVKLDNPTLTGSIVPGRYFVQHLQRYEL